MEGYLWNCGMPTTKILRRCLQIGETADYRWVTAKELMAMPQESMVTPKDLLRKLIPALAE